MNKFLKIGIISFLVILLIGLGVHVFFIFKDNEDTLNSLREEASVYEKEKESILTDLEGKRRLIAPENDAASINIAFFVTSEQQLEKVEEIMSQYSFNPTICVNLDASAVLINKIQDKNYEIILTSSPIDEEKIENIDDISIYNAFLLRNSEDNMENIGNLKNLGFKNVLRYAESKTPNILDNGIYSIGYSYISSDTVAFDTRITSTVTQRGYLSFVMDMQRLEDKYMTESSIKKIINACKYEEGQNRVLFKTINEIVNIIKENKVEEDANREAYEEYAKEKQVRIDELNAIIDNIYSKWNNK